MAQIICCWLQASVISRLPSVLLCFQVFISKIQIQVTCQNLIMPSSDLPKILRIFVHKFLNNAIPDDRKTENLGLKLSPNSCR